MAARLAEDPRSRSIFEQNLLVKRLAHTRNGGRHRTIDAPRHISEGRLAPLEEIDELRAPRPRVATAVGGRDGQRRGASTPGYGPGHLAAKAPLYATQAAPSVTSATGLQNSQLAEDLV